MSELSDSRRRFLVRWRALTENLERETGWVPRAATWAIPMVSAAAGFALGVALSRVLHRRLQINPGRSSHRRVLP